MAFKSRYPWLKDLKEKSQKKNNIELTKITVMGGSPISGRTDIGFTGYGEDGQLQPNKPTSMFGAMGGPVMEHEGEARIELPDGEKTVIPANQLNQDILQKLDGKMRGAKTGGTFQPAAAATPVSPIGGMQPQIGGGQVTPVEPQIGGGQVTPVEPQIGGGQVTPVQPQIGGGQVTPMQPQIGGGQVTPMQPQIGQAVDPRMAISPLGGQIKTPVAEPPPVSQTVSPIAPKPPEAVVTPSTEDKGSVEYQQALQRLKKIGAGYDPVAEKIREEERMRLAGEEAAAKGSLEQYASQMGLTGRELLTEQAMLGREFGAQEATLMANLRKGEADRAFQASMALPGATLAGMQFQYQKQFDAVAQSNWEQAMAWDKETWQKQFGFNKDVWEAEFGQNKEEWEQMTAFEREKWLMDNSQWQQMFDLGKEKWDYGKKLDMVQALMQQGGPENLQKASDMLESVFGEGVDFTNALNAENQQQFFNGMDIMSSSIASGLSWEETIKALEQGGLMDKMGMSESDLKGMYDNMKLQNDSVYQATKLTDSWVEQGFMTQDEADKYIALIKGGLLFPEGFEISDGFVLMDKDGKEVEFFETQEEMEAWMKENPGDYKSVFKKNHITSKEGSGEGSSGESGDGPSVPADAGSGDVFVKGGIVYKVDENGVAQEFFDHDLPENAKVGDTFLGDGNLYVLGSGGIARQITDEVLTDIWSDDANLAIKHGEDSPYRENILKRRVESILGGNAPEGNWDMETYNAFKQSGDVTKNTFKDETNTTNMDMFIRDDSFDGKGDRYVVGEFENLNPGVFVVVNGSVLKFVSKFRKGRGGTDGTGYDFINAHTGKKVRIYNKGELEYR